MKHSHRYRLLGVAVFVLFLLLAPTAQAAECLPSDFLSTYTECIDGYRNLIYYKNPASSCTGTDNQPENVYGVPCAISCPSGKYLPLGSSSEAACTPCPSGQYSLGGGLLIEGPSWVNNSRGWSGMSNQQVNFRSTCINSRNGGTPTLAQCSKWIIVDGMFTYSGKTSDSHVSTLEATANFVRDGHISFEYRVDAERGFDYLTFEIDETVLVGPVSQQLQYIKVEFNVTQGTHVFRWKYSKDFSLSFGDDSAFLKSIQFTGTAFADSSCTLCRPGSFASSMGSSSCQLCPANTAAPHRGTSSCTRCGVNEYSFPGSTFCNASLPCVQADVVSYHSSCFPNNTRSQYFYYQSPKICSDTLPGAYIKPEDKYNLPCAPCSAGWERNSATGLCESCPTNKYSVSGGTCTPCPSGSVGRRDFIWSNFDELPPSSIPARMGCQGECGTQGWRLGPNYIDSGIGHGSPVESYFTLNITTLSAGFIKVNMSFACNRLCYLTLIDTDVTNPNAPVIANAKTYYSYFYPSTVFTQELPVGKGDHMFSWTFGKYDSTSMTRDDQARIWAIEIESVAEGQGGAASCQDCVAGQYADNKTPYCIPNPPGTYSGPRASNYTLCPAGTYAEKPGSTECYNCGHGTTSAPGSAWCDESCTFRANAGSAYDLKPLSRVGGDMWGPIQEVSTANHRTYYLNVCTRLHTNTTCYNDDLQPLSTQACMSDPWGFGLDLGRVTNFYPHPTNPDNGVTITYTNASSDSEIPCWEWTESGPVRVPRLTNITFNCDPLAGYGQPIVDETWGSSSCEYRFTWNSLFACPTCDDSDWNYYYTECINGVQYKTYQWKDNPRRCHGGLPLPEPVSRPCSVLDQTPCPAGQYLLDECTNCPEGSFSLGGTKIFNDWTYGVALPPQFTASFGVMPQGHYVEMILSQPTDFVTRPSHETLALELNFVSRGTVNFVYSSLVGKGYSLTLAVDSQPPIKVGTHLRVFDHPVTVGAGTHVFTWNLTMTSFAKPGTTSFLRLYNVTAHSTSKAASKCTSSLPGTYIASPSSPALPCPVNTYQPLAERTSCDPVPVGKWAPSGSEKYYDAVECQTSDFDALPTSACTNGQMSVNLIPKQPQTCRGGVQAGAITVPCGCPPGFNSDQNGQCRSCPSGSYWDSQRRSCFSAPPGSATVNIWSLVKGRVRLPDPDPTYEFNKKSPKDAEVSWQTTCMGSCVRAWGLAMDSSNGPLLESGVQVGSSISALYFRIPMRQHGTLKIKFTHLGGATTFKILLDGSVIYSHNSPDSLTSTFEYQIQSSGSHEIALALIADEEQQAHSAVQITDLTITGSELGAPQLVQCPAGYYSVQSGSSQCIPCAPGTENPSLGATSCTDCPGGTYASHWGTTTCSSCTATSGSSKAASLCTPMCNMVGGTGETYNVKDLSQTTARMTVEQRQLGWPLVDINLCGPLDGACTGPDGTANMAFVCGASPLSSNPNERWNFGDSVSVIPPQTKMAPITFEFSNGDVCSPRGDRRKTIVELRCPVAGSVSQPSPVMTEASDCLVKMLWVTASACPACLKDDYTPILSKCTKRTQTITWELKPGSTCHHSEDTIPPKESRKCSEIPLSIGFVIAIGGVFILFIIGAVAFCVRYQRLNVEYKLLKDAHHDQFDANETQFGIDDEDEVSLDNLDDDGLRLPQPAKASLHEDL